MTFNHFLTQLKRRYLSKIAAILAMASVWRKSPKATDTLLPGQISYLKKRAYCNDEDLSSVDLSDGCFDHLVIILSTDTRNAQAEALIVSLSKKEERKNLDIERADINQSLRPSEERPLKSDIRTIAASDFSICQ